LTRAKRTAGAATFAVVVLLTVAHAAGQLAAAPEGGVDGRGPVLAATRGDSTPGGASSGPGPAQALVASAAYPGLGQLLNDSEYKAALVGGVEAFLIARLVLEDRRTRHALRLYNETQDSRYYDEYSSSFDTRQTLIWWVVVAALYGIADAYVDAHLVSFDEIGPTSSEDWSVAPTRADGGLRIGLACRF